jgi:anti-repressor protein
MDSLQLEGGKQMNQLQVFENELFKVSAKTEGDQILFDAEQVAKCLGITQTKGNLTFVRWGRVNSYLPTNSPEVGKGDLIPESLVYKLAFKAKSELAEKFQDWLAIEVIPSIRKHGAYMTSETIEKVLTDPDTLIKLATTLKEEKQKRLLAEQTLEKQKPKVLFANAVETSNSSVLVGELAKIMKQNGVNIGQNRLFEWLRDNGYLIKSGESKNLPTQRSMEQGLFEIKKRTINNPDGSVRVTSTPKVTGKGQIYFVDKFLKMKSEV